MSTTTQILFNSPALHSLKRDQLVKLCKTHSIKASGKNIELIERLKQHAQTLPRDSPLSVAARSEGLVTGVQKYDEPAEDDRSGMNYSGQMSRPSEQWEVVMESIQEQMEDTSSQGTLSSLRTLTNGGSEEFGSGNSKSSTMSSSIKALASSFGLKRHNASKSTLVDSSSSKSISSLSSTSEELAKNSMPYSSLPEVDVVLQTDHFTFDPPMQSKTVPATSEEHAPLPGHSLRPGVPVPSNARLSLGTSSEPQLTTTIRLISNPHNPPSNGRTDTFIGRTPQLKAFQTSFDLIMGSPTSPTSGLGSRGITLWPPDDPKEGGQDSLYPIVPSELRSTTIPEQDDMDSDADVPMPGSLSFPPPQTPASPTLGAPLQPVEPFVFGSPLPQHNVTNSQFKSVAASVLGEMNKRLQAEGVQGVGIDIIGKLQPGTHVDVVQSQVGRELNLKSKGGGMIEKFEKMHEEDFKKMEGIDGFLKRTKRGADEIKKMAIAKKRKSSVGGHGAGRDRFGRRVGGQTPGRLSGRVISAGKRPRVLPGSFGDGEEEEDSVGRHGEDVKPAEEATTDPFQSSDTSKDKEQDEAGKEQAEDGKLKERQAIKRKLELNKARRKSSVAGARGRVSVGRGGILIKPQPKPARFGFLSSAKSLVQSVFGRGKAAASSSTAPKVAPSKVKKTVPPPAVPAPKKAVPPVTSRSSAAVNPSIRNKTTSLRFSPPSHARSPIPPFDPTPSTSTRNNLTGTSGTKASRTSSNIGTSTSKSGGISSIGTRMSSASSSKLSGTITSTTVSSMGSKNVDGTAVRSSSPVKLPARISSRLLAPTASSLAKITRPSALGLKLADERNATTGFKPDAAPGALGMITNSPGQGAFYSRPGKIFSKPLEVPSGIPVPIKRRNVGPSASSVAGGSDVNIPAVSDVGEIKEPNSPNSTITGSTKQRSLNGRKPRISRSKVIARLASQRAASAGGSGNSHGVRAAGTPSQGRVRSSLGAKAQRSSYGGKSLGAGRVRGSGGDVMMSAKKRARQSEYARRRSRIEPLNLTAAQDGVVTGEGMDVDPDQ